MDIINEIQFNNVDAIRLSTSSAGKRKNTVRIHYHTFIEIALVVKGKGLYKVGDNIYTINSGDMFFYRPNEPHCITDIEDENMQLINLHINPSYVYSNFQDALNSNYVKILSVKFHLKSNKINDTMSQENFSIVKNFFLNIKKELEEENNDYISLVKNHISSMLIYLSRPYKTISSSKTEKYSCEKIISIINYIDLHYKENLTLSELSKKTFYSRCYFSSLFKQCIGMSVWDYISIKRIEEALYLIKTTNKSITEIALNCGFNNTTNFNKLFKKYTNTTPRSLRK